MKAITTSPGKTEPLGATVEKNGINFAVVSTNATQLYVLLFDTVNDITPAHRLPMERSGDSWHLFVDGISNGAYYCFAADGPYDPGSGHRFISEAPLLDPYTRMVSGDKQWQFPSEQDLLAGKGVTEPFPKCVARRPARFDWQGTASPDTPMVESVIYELSVAGYTGHQSSGVKHRGTYLGLLEKIPHLVELGVTAVELMPIMEWEYNAQLRDLESGEVFAVRQNVWGYMSRAFMAPDAGLATRPGRQVDELKLLIRELHKAGIEVILDIVFNHSPESNGGGPVVSFRGLDNKVYFLLAPNALHEYKNYSGCGNTVNCNHPHVRRLILDVLRHWVEEFHVDGFRFDLGAVFGIKEDLSVSSEAPVLMEIAADPVLSRVKLIAEPWSVGVYLMGKFPAPFSEWCGRFRDIVRRFIKGDRRQLGELGTCVTGSQDWFGSAGERHAVNFVTAHDGFTMMDLVSYNEKHNGANQESNRDGEDHNDSWNCGVEGPVTRDSHPQVWQLRRQQIKNFLTMLMVSRGTPMVLSGDEMGKSNGGNNNIWSQPELNRIDWNLLAENPDLFRFFKMIIAFRRTQFLGGRGQKPIYRPIIWHGVEPCQADWSDWSRLIAWQLDPFPSEEERGDTVYFASNAHEEPIRVTLPPGEWVRIVDTSLECGEDIVEIDRAEPVGPTYTISARSSIVLLNKTISVCG